MIDKGQRGRCRATHPAARAKRKLRHSLLLRRLQDRRGCGPLLQEAADGLTHLGTCRRGRQQRLYVGSNGPAWSIASMRQGCGTSRPLPGWQHPTDQHTRRQPTRPVTHHRLCESRRHMPACAGMGSPGSVPMAGQGAAAEGRGGRQVVNGSEGTVAAAHALDLSSHCHTPVC